VKCKFAICPEKQKLYVINLPAVALMISFPKIIAMNRKNFLFTVASSAAGLTLVSTKIFSQTTAQQDPPPQIPVNVVKDFVGAGHRDLGKVQSMITEYPNIVHCTYDWGNGDFESAIEGAGHVGNRPIAEYLINNGSRVTLFALAMLGKNDLVKPVLEAFPKLVFANGPHGFTLLHHAKLAGKEGEELYNYLWEKGLKETHNKIK
jgi:hypothetical protein